MLLPRFVGWMFSIAILALYTCGASGQNFPNKAIRIVTNAAGGGADLAARLIAQRLTNSVGQPVVVDNRGGTGIAPALAVSNASPDGYTLLLSSGALWTLPLLETTPYDPITDFLPITLAARSPNILVVHPSLPVKSVKELIALAKAKPGALNYGAGGRGSSNQLAAELFKAMAGVNIIGINYKGGGPALNDLIAGHVQVMFASVGSVAPFIKTGRLRALAITSAQPSELFPALATVAASGVPGYEVTTVYVLFAPSKTLPTIIKRLNEEIVRVLNRPDVQEKFFNAGVEVVGSSPERLAVTIKSEIATLGKLIKDAGIRQE